MRIRPNIETWTNLGRQYGANLLNTYWGLFQYWDAGAASTSSRQPPHNCCGAQITYFCLDSAQVDISIVLRPSVFVGLTGRPPSWVISWAGAQSAAAAESSSLSTHMLMLYSTPICTSSYFHLMSPLSGLWFSSGGEQQIRVSFFCLFAILYGRVNVYFMAHRRVVVGKGRHIVIMND